MDYKDKIRKLLALAKSPEPEEAKFALLKARKLMAEHIYTNLGNGINHELCMKFVKSGYDLKVIEESV